MNVSQQEPMPTFHEGDFVRLNDMGNLKLRTALALLDWDGKSPVRINALKSEPTSLLDGRGTVEDILHAKLVWDINGSPQDLDTPVVWLEHASPPVTN